MREGSGCCGASWPPRARARACRADPSLRELSHQQVKRHGCCVCVWPRPNLGCTNGWISKSVQPTSSGARADEGREATPRDRSRGLCRSEATKRARAHPSIGARRDRFPSLFAPVLGMPRACLGESCVTARHAALGCSLKQGKTTRRRVLRGGPGVRAGWGRGKQRGARQRKQERGRQSGDVTRGQAKGTQW